MGRIIKQSFCKLIHLVDEYPERVSVVMLSFLNGGKQKKHFASLLMAAVQEG